MSIPRPAPEAPRGRELALGVAALVAVQVFFGLFPLFVKLVTGGPGGLSPRALVAWRISVGSAVLLPLAFVRHGRRALPERADLRRLALCALLGIVVNQGLATEGMHRTLVVNAGILMSLIPVFTYLLAVLARQERFLPGRSVGIAVAMAGALILILTRHGVPELRARHREGDLMIVANCLSYSLFLVLARALLRRHPPLVVLAWVYALSLWAVPLFAAGVDLVPGGRTAWWSLAYILLFPTVIAYLLNIYALARVAASTTAVFIYLQPLVGGAAGILLRGERPGVSALVAALLLFGGIALVMRREARAREAPAHEPG